MTGAPSKPDRRTASMIRVDQAGEYGATRIYAGQLAVMGDRHPMAREIAHMAEQEERHRKFFDALVRSEEHTSELQSLMRISSAVFCLKQKKTETYNIITHKHIDKTCT